MLVNPIVKKLENGNSAAQQIWIDTSTFNRVDLQDCIIISTEIERQKQLNKSHRRLNNPTTLDATMIQEHDFECPLENHRFLMALEDENLFGPRLITDLDASLSIENVNAESGSSGVVTPTKSPCTGAVATAIASLHTQMSKSFGSPPPPYQDVLSPISCCERAEPEVPTSSTKELRKKYEQPVGAEQELQKKTDKSKNQRKSPSPAQPTTTSKAQKSQTLPRNSKVKQLAQLFNSKISQLMGHDSIEKQDSNSSIASQKPPKKPAVMKPVPTVRSSLSTSNTSLPSPARSDSEKACIVAEDVFRQLSVKDKVLLYNKFIEDTSKQYPQVGMYTRVVEITVRNELARIEKAVTSPKVKEIASELELKLNLSAPRISTWGLKAMQPGYDAVKRRTSTASTPVTAATHRLQKANEAISAAIESDEKAKVEELHTGKLAVVLRPSPERGANLPKQRVPPRPLPRKIREQRFVNDMKIIERVQKRCSKSSDTYGPPKKIQRTWTERFQPKEIFRNMQMETMFYDWIMEKYGVTFVITTVENSEDSCTNADEANTSKSSVKSKSKVFRLFGKAMSKLGSVESQVMRRDSIGGQNIDKSLNIINETLEQQNTKISAIGVNLPINQIGTSIDGKIQKEPSKRVQRKVKRQAPQPPKAIREAREHRNAKKCVIESELPISQIDISIDEKIPEAPSNRVQRKVKRQAPQPPTAIIETRKQQDTNTPASTAQKTIQIEEPKYAAPQKERQASQRLTIAPKTDNPQSQEQNLSTVTSSNNKLPNNAVMNANSGQNIKKSQINQKIFNEMAKSARKAFELEQQKAKMGESILNNMNLSGRIKGGYKLSTLLTPPPTPYKARPLPSTPEMVGKCGMGQTFLTSPSKVQREMKSKSAPEKLLNSKTTEAKHSSKGRTPPEDTLQNLIASFIDLGFETGSNDRKSPYRTVIRSDSPLFFKLTPEPDKSRQQSPFIFSSTPAKGLQNQPRQNFSNNTTRRLRRISMSPIGPVNGGRRRLWHANDSCPSSPAMQVSWNDRPVEQVELSKTPDSPISTESSFVGTTFNFNMTNNTEQQEMTSMFWVRAVDITISLEIFYNPRARLSLLHEIFSQKSCESRDLNFGIDDHKFSIRNSIEKADISTRLPPVKGCSHYWFSAGELAVPFKGKSLASEKIRRFFNFLKDSMTDNQQLRFGVDDYEFSAYKENSHKFSEDSNCSKLAGLHGNSNGMEKSSRNLNSLKARNLNFSESDSKIDPQNVGLTTESPCGTKYLDVPSENSRNMTLSRYRNATGNESCHNEKFNIETLEKQKFRCQERRDASDSYDIRNDKKSTENKY